MCKRLASRQCPAVRFERVTRPRRAFLVSCEGARTHAIAPVGLSPAMPCGGAVAIARREPLEPLEPLQPLQPLQPLLSHARILGR